MTAAPGASPLQPEDYFEIGHATDAQISPDGRFVCYVRYRPDRGSDSHSCTVILVEVATSAETVIGKGVSPRWSPDGTRIAFLRREAAAQQIFLWDVARGAASQLTRVSESCEGLAWSPDGASIAFVKRVPQPEAPRIAPRWAEFRNEHWAKPGVYSEQLVRRVEGMSADLPGGNYHVFIANAGDGQIAQLTHGPFDHGGPLAHTVKVVRSGRISWTPDGGSIVMSLYREPAVAGPIDPRASIDCDVYEYAISTGAVKRLTQFDGVTSNATVSPDGRWIAFVGFRNERKAFHTNVLHVMDRRGGEPRALAHPEGLEVHPGLQWMPDSSGVLVLFTRAGRGCLARVKLDGDWVLITDQLGGSAGSGYVLWEKSISVSRQGALAFTTGRENQADEVAVGSVAGGPVRALTNGNAQTLGRRSLASVSEFWCRSRVDQLPIQCWITRPPGFDATRRYPLILWIHGGPYLSWCGHFALTPQLLAARGYLVLMVNPRGSLGYGEDFTGLIDRKFPGDDYLDLLDAVDAAIALGSVLERHLYVAGESGGGVLASWIIGKTSRFAAAGIIYPITDWSSMALTVDRPDYYPFYWMGGMPWEPGMHEEYWARSPLSIVGDVETPALLVCGEKDWRTPIAQSEMYFTALKLRGVDAALVRFPDNNHGLEWHPSHSLELIEYLDYWFRRHAPAGEA